MEECLKRAGLEALDGEETSPLGVSEAIVIIQRHERSRQARARFDHIRDSLVRIVSNIVD